MKYIRRMLAGCVMALAVSPAMADTISATYLCERGVEVPMVYVNPSREEEPAIVVLMAEGRLIRLEQIISASGARYGWPADGSFYEWWEHQGTATLSWVDGETNESSPIYRDCAPQE